MPKILIVAGESQATQQLLTALALIDGQPQVVGNLAAARDALAGEPPDLAAVELGLRPPGHAEMTAFLGACKRTSPITPILVLLPVRDLAAYEASTEFDDFAASPCSAQELAARMQRLIRKSKPAEAASVFRYGDLTIDLGRYEVSQDGKRMDLTFKEYELLKFLATNPSKVFTREVLLNRVWGYDYFGGTRTVDVHIRRLRSKIENGRYTFIDTVRNVGYRFTPPT